MTSQVEKCIIDEINNLEYEGKPAIEFFLKNRFDITDLDNHERGDLISIISDLTIIIYLHHKESTSRIEEHISTLKEHISTLKENTSILKEYTSILKEYKERSIKYKDNLKCLINRKKVVANAEKYLVTYIETSIKNTLTENAQKAVKAKIARYNPLIDFTINEYLKRNYKSRRNAAMTLKPSVLAFGKTIDVNLSELQAETTIYNWLKKSGY